MKIVTGLLIENHVAKVVQFEDKLENYYRLLKCDTIEMPTRYILGKPYCLVVDEEGLLKKGLTMNAYSSEPQEILVGNILIVGIADKKGNVTSLTLQDVTEINAVLTKFKGMLVYSFGRNA